MFSNRFHTGATVGLWLSFWTAMLCCAQAASPDFQAPAPSDVKAPPANAHKTRSGLAIRILERGHGADHPKDNDCVKVKFTGWKRDGKFLSSSIFQGEVVVQCVRYAIPGIAEAFKLMVVGEKCRVWLPAWLTFIPAAYAVDNRADDNPLNSGLTFDVEIIELLKAPSTPARLKTPPRAAMRTASGLALQVLKNGEGRVHPSAASEVLLHYSGWTTDGKMFESTVMGGHPASFLVGTMLPGWQEGLPYMVVGEKVRLWIPAALAYGERPRNHDLPAGDLVYEIELLAIN